MNTLNQYAWRASSLLLVQEKPDALQRHREVLAEVVPLRFASPEHTGHRY